MVSFKDRYYKWIILTSFIFCFANKAYANIAVDETSYNFGEPVIFTTEGGPYEIYNITDSSYAGSYGTFIPGDSLSFSYADNHQYGLVEVNQPGGCHNSNLSYQQCKDSAMYVSDTTFIVGNPPPPAPPPSSSDNSGGTASSNAVKSYEPLVSITAPTFLMVSSSTVFISYEATDKNDSDPTPSIRQRLGLGPKPVSLYYGTSGDVRKKILIAKDLPAVGTYLWKTRGLPDLDTYYIIADVVDNVGETGESQVGEFTIDHSVPVFTVTTDPQQTRGEDVSITIQSSKELADIPVVNVTQTNFVPTSVDMTGDKTIFKGVYQVVTGYDGTAQISVTGTDNIGNIATKIISGGTFTVGQSNPIKAVSRSSNNPPVASPSSAPISVPATNPETVAVPKPVEVQPAQPTPTAGPLTVNLLYPKEGRGVGGVAQIEWQPDDFHADKIKNVTLSYRKGNGPYTVIASNITNQKVLWDVSALKEGKDYELKVDAFDGKTTSEGIRKIIVDNTPPKIQVSPSVPNSSTTPFLLTASGQATDNLSGVDFVEYSVDGEHWFKANMIGSQLSNKTEFAIKYPFTLEDGTYNVRYRAVDGAGNQSKPYVAKIILDQNAPRVGSYSITKGSTMLLPSAGNRFDVLVDDSLNFKISLESDTDSAYVNIGGSDIPLTLGANGLWTSDISFDKLGIFDILVGAKDKIGKAFSGRKIGEIEVKQRGVVAPGAQISVYIFDAGEKSYVRWQGEESGTVNPFTANIDGKYNLLLPAGKYYLKIEKDGFENVHSDKFELNGPSYINLDFSLTKLNGLRSMFEPIISKLMFYEN